MKLSLRGEYALRALVALGEAAPGDIVPIHLVSEQQQIPKRFLEQILNDLRSGGFVESKRGIAGGYRLSRTAKDLPLLDIIQHVEGILSPSESIRQPRLRPGAREAQQAINGIMNELTKAMEKTLDRFTLDDLCVRTRQARQADAPDYAI